MKLKYSAGHTPLVKIKLLSKKFDLDDILVKDESKNRFGTFKDRASEFIVKKALDKHVDKAVIITSGNFGYSLSRFAEGTELKIICIIDKKIKKSIEAKLVKAAYKVIKADLSKILEPEQVISLARESREEKIWDIDHEFHQAYVNIIKEIKKDKPDYIITPVGSGASFVGLYSGIKKYKLKTKLIGVGVKQKLYSYADKLWAPRIPYAKEINSILEDGHKYIKLSEKEIKKSYNEFKNIIKCEPSSAVVFAALSKIKFSKDDKIILINSGRGMF
jgi:threonine synthase